MELWHRQLGHLNVKSICALQSMLRDMNLGKIFYPTSMLFCEACTEGKQYVAKLDNGAKRQTTKPLEIVHWGVCGP